MNAAPQSASTFRWLLIAVACAWGLSLLVSPVVISPATDDGFYALMPIAFFAEHSIGTYYLREFDRVFYVLPGYFYLQSLFYYPLLLLGLDYNFVTAKLHQAAICAGLVAATWVLVVRLSEPATGRLRAALALAALAATPFVQDAMNLRPEPAGLLATALALVMFHRGMTAAAPDARWLSAAAFALGLAATMHPTFIITSGGVGLAALVLVSRRSQWRQVLLCLAAGCLPIAVMLAWYLINLPESWQALSANAELRSGGWRNPTGGLIDIVRLAFLQDGGGGLSLARLNQALLYQVMFWCVVAAVLCAVRWLRTPLTPAQRDTAILALVLLAMALLNIMLNASTRLQFHVVLSYPAVLVAALGLPLGWLARGLSRSRLLMAGLIAACVLAVLFAPLAHTLKHLAPGTRYHPLTLMAALQPALGSAGRIYFSDDRFLLALSDQVVETLRGAGRPETYWTLPYVVGSPQREQKALHALICDIAGLGDKPLIWVVSSNRLGPVDESAGKAVVLSRTYGDSRALEYSMRFDDILYRAHDVLALRGRVDEVREILDGGARLTLYQPPHIIPSCTPQ